MDTSKEYVLMCEKAVEIQESYKCEDAGCWNEGDVYVSDNEVYIASMDGESGLPEKEDCEIWLPRQDQLQDMLGGFKELFPNGTKELEINHQHCKSFEQLWLAFVMKKKYNKTWNGTDWRIE